MNVLYISLLLAISTSKCSLVGAASGQLRRRTKAREQRKNNDHSLIEKKEIKEPPSPSIKQENCTITELSGIYKPINGTFRDNDVLIATCQKRNYILKPSETKGERIKKSKGMKAGRTSISIPSTAIQGNAIVLGDDDNVTVYDGDDYDDEIVGRKLQHTGIKKVVIVVVTDDQETSGDLNKVVPQSPAQLRNDVFYDENNLAKVYAACSNNQLTFKPSQNIYIAGATFDNGVHTIYTRSWNYCDVKWIDVSRNLQLDITNYDADYMMVVMPNCVDFEDAAGWGMTPGQMTWYPSDYISYPVVQVHEMGHNFGHRHSGKNGVSYADDTGYMGNQASWSDTGSAMCFNAAKLWYFNWFPGHKLAVKVSDGAFSGKLVGVGEASAATWSDEIVVKVLTERSNVAELFIVFNAAVGANIGVVGDRNLIVVTSQPSQWDESSWVAALDSGEMHKEWSWGPSGQTLVIKNCGGDWSTQPFRALLVVAFDGNPLLNCNSGSSGGNGGGNGGSSGGNGGANLNSGSGGNVGGGGSDGLGTKLDMTDYFQQKDAIFGTGYVTKCNNIPDWYDADGMEFTCEWYARNSVSCNNERHPNLGHTAQTACCACGGGTETILYDGSSCQNTIDWKDSDGKPCSWYQKSSLNCINHGDRHPNLGKTANEACCYCKEGLGLGFER